MTDKTDALIRKLALHVRPTCSELYDEAMQALAEQPAGVVDVVDRLLSVLPPEVRSMNGYDAAWATGFNEGVSQARENISRALIDSAGGAKGEKPAVIWDEWLDRLMETCDRAADEQGFIHLADGRVFGSRELFTAITSRFTPQPDGGEGAVTLESAPIGTQAPAIGGGHWTRVEHGWQWCTGAVFPRPGGDWDGKLILPKATRPSAAAAAPEGWKLVPIVATPSMDAAGKEALSDNGVDDVHDADALVCFAAMLAAAPAAPKGGVVDERFRIVGKIVGPGGALCWNDRPPNGSLLYAANPRAEQENG